MVPFVETFDHVRADVIAPMLKRDRHRDYTLDDVRLREAEAVAECVVQFTDYEANPPPGKGVGRYGRPSMIPPLGTLLGAKTMAGLDAEAGAQLRDEVAAAVACGYAGVVCMEPDSTNIEPRIDDPPRETWGRWVALLNANVVESAGIEGALRDSFCQVATDRFATGLQRLDLLPRFRKQMRFGALGQWYGEAGMVLRLVQAAGPKNDPGTEALIAADRWPFVRAR